MNHIEAAAMRHLPTAEAGSIRPLELALGASPVLTAATLQTVSFVLAAFGSGLSRSACVTAPQHGTSVGELLDARRRGPAFG